MDIRIRAAGASDRGRTRRTNEDAFGFDLDRGLFIVCDGVGGNAAGEVASRSAIDCVLSRFPHCMEDSTGAGFELQRAIHAANRSIRAAQQEEAYAGMCTTIVTAHFDGSRMWVGHIGDSRAYLLRRGSLHRLTDDDSRLAQILREGHQRVSPAEVASLDSTLTQALGASDVVVPSLTMVQVELDDCFLLATDGICKTLANSDMLSLLLASSTPEQACQHLIHAADAAGGYDNATCILVTID